MAVPVLVYLATSIAARHANGEPWSGILLQASVLAILSVGCVGLSWVPRSRVLMIAGLGRDATLLVEAGLRCPALHTAHQAQR